MKMRILNFEQCHSAEKRKTSILLQNVEKNERKHFGAIKIFSKRLRVPNASMLKTPRDP